MPSEKRIGATGLPNEARANNVKRYELSRRIYDLHINGERVEGIDSVLPELEGEYKSRPLDFGGSSATANQKGNKKSGTKAKEESNA